MLGNNNKLRLIAARCKIGQITEPNVCGNIATTTAAMLTAFDGADSDNNMIFDELVVLQFVHYCRRAIEFSHYVTFENVTVMIAMRCDRHLSQLLADAFYLRGIPIVSWVIAVYDGVATIHDDY